MALKLQTNVQLRATPTDPKHIINIEWIGDRFLRLEEENQELRDMIGDLMFRVAILEGFHQSPDWDNTNTPWDTPMIVWR